MNAASLDALGHYKLACSWRRRGRRSQAARHYRTAIEIDPGCLPAYEGLADVLLAEARVAEALELYERAAAREPADAHFAFGVDFLRRRLESRRSHKPSTQAAVPAGAGIRLRDQVQLEFTRGGWRYALAALAPLHREDGILFDGFVEHNFAWRHRRSGIRPLRALQAAMAQGTFEQLATSEERGITPYTRPWIGICHNPHSMPDWFHYRHESPQAIFAKAIWQESLPHCLGLFTLSRHHAGWLARQTGKPVSVLRHPAEPAQLTFSVEKFLANSDRQIVQIGWWLRKLSAIYRLPLSKGNPGRYRKVRLVPIFFKGAEDHQRQLIEREVELEGLVDEHYRSHTSDVRQLPDHEYDLLLSRNLAFAELYDSNANNLVVECMVRATPLLINPLPAVVEYLGPSYPFYFTSLEEAAAKALDFDLVAQTHDYLKRHMMKDLLTGEAFLQSFVNSAVYQGR